MNAQELGKNYDKIATWWDDTINPTYGLSYLEKAISLSKRRGKALDVGCGSGGRMIETMLEAGYAITALDVSSAMLDIAASKHPGVTFVHADFMSWRSEEKFDLVVAWDSIFHAPQAEQADVLRKLCSHLAPSGVLIFTGGDVDGEVRGEMRGVSFEYGSISNIARLQIIEDSNCDICTLERDQPKHMVYICRK